STRGGATRVEVAVSSPALSATRDVADKLEARLATIPSLRDLQFEQSLDYPAVQVDVDRERAGVLGVKTSEVSRALTAATSSSRYTAPVSRAHPGTGLAYQVQVEIPEAREDPP